MLPKEKRLTDTRDFKRVYQKGLFFSTPLFNVNYLKNKTAVTRLGIVINKKTAAKAVNRNKTKRRLREAARGLYDKLPSGYDLIINAKAGAVGASVKELQEKMAEIEKRIR